MKLFTVSTTFLSLLGAVYAQQDSSNSQDASSPPVASASKVASSPSKPFSTDNIITKVTFPDSVSNNNKLPEFVNEKETRVEFFFLNNDTETPIHIAGYFGSFYQDYFNNKKNTNEQQPLPYANLTTTKIGPLAVEPGKNVTFEGKIKVSLPPEDFDLVLSFFVGALGDMAVVKHDPIRVSVVDPPVSLFDPKFLLAQIILALTVATIGYFVYFAYLEPYYHKSRLSFTKAKREKGASASAADGHKKSPVKKGSVADVIEKKKAGEKGYDESWIPKEHLSAAASSSSAKTKKN